MKLLRGILVILLIAVTTHMGSAQEEAVGSEADPEVGSPLGGLVIAKGIKKLALFEGIKKIKLKLSKLGLKKGLFLAKIPWLASANPNADGGENMDGSDTYYIGIPEVGAHMWSGQTFDSDFHPELARFEEEDLQDWHNHLRYQHDPHARNVHESEYISAHTEGHPMTEIYSFVDTNNQPIPYHNRHFTETEHEFDPLEQEGQESRYYVTSVRNPNEGAVPAMSRDISINEGSDRIKNSQYTEYSPEAMVQNINEKSNMQSAQYHILKKEDQSKEMSPEQIPIWYAPSDESNIQSNIPSTPGQSLQTNQDAQAPTLVWNTNSNMPRTPTQETQRTQLNQETRAPMYAWNTQKVGEKSQPQIVVWQPAKSEEMAGSQNTVFDNMSHLSKEEENVHPIIMREYVQAVQGHDQRETSIKNHKYYDNNVQVPEYNSAIMPSEYVAKEGYAAADDTEPKWTLLTTGTTQENKQTYAYPTKETCIKTKSKIDVTSRISMEGAGIEKRQMVSNTCGSSAFTEAFTRLAQATQNAQTAKSMESTVSSKSEVVNKGLSQYSNIQEQQGPERAMEQQQMLSNQEVSKSAVDERTMTQEQEQMYYAMEPQQMMYQPVSGDSRAADDQTPHVVIDNQPLSAFILPSEHQPTAEVIPDPAAPRTSYEATQSQVQNQQDDQLQYQAPASQNYYNPANAPQYSHPSGQQYSQYGYQRENPTAPVYRDDAGQYRSEVEDQENQSYALQRDEEAENPSEADVGHMEPQDPDHARTFHKKLLFGLKKKHKFGGHKSTHYHYHTHGGYGGQGYGSYGYGGHGYGSYGGQLYGGYGHGGYGHGGYGQGGYGHGGHGYYSHGYGYLGQQNPSGDASQQDATQGQEMQDSAPSHISSNTEMVPSASNNDPQIMKPSEPTCPCARSWNEGSLPAYNDDRRGYYGYGSADMVGSPFTALLSRPYLGMWGPNSLLAPLYRQPQYFVPERFDEGAHERFQRDSAKAMVDNLALAAKDKLQELKMKKPRPLSDILIDKPQILELIKKECDENCNKCKKDCDNVEDKTEEPSILSNEKEI